MIQQTQAVAQPKQPKQRKPSTVLRMALYSTYQVTFRVGGSSSYMCMAVARLAAAGKITAVESMRTSRLIKDKLRPYATLSTYLLLDETPFAQATQYKEHYAKFRSNGGLANAKKIHAIRRKWYKELIKELQSQGL